MDDEERFVDTAGLGGEERMYYAPWKCRCGQIEDGVSIRTCHMRGGFVVALTDLERIVSEARKERGL